MNKGAEDAVWGPLRGNGTKVLLVDDNDEERDVTAFLLRRDGYEVVEAQGEAQALRRFRLERPDLIALSWDSSRVESLLRQIRAEAPTPVMVTVARDDGADVLRCFELGADDFIARPFTRGEFALRVRALLGRASHAVRAELEAPVEVGDLRLDPETMSASRAGAPVGLTPTEFRICYTLVRNVERVVLARRLRALVGGTEGGAANSLRSHISRLRRKLALDGGPAGAIVSVTAVGYVFRAPLGSPTTRGEGASAMGSAVGG